MKKLLLSFTIIILSMLISCRVSSNNENLYLKDKEKISKYTRLKGLVEVIGKEIFIVVNPECKCRRSFKVVGSKKEELKKLKGLFVEVEGYIKNYSPWSGVISVKKIYILEK